MMHEKMKTFQGWDEKDVQQGLAHVLPIVMGMSKVAPLLKGMQALGHYQGGHERHVVQHPSKADEEPDVRLDTIRPERLRGSGYGRGSGIKFTITGNSNWHGAGTGRVVDALQHRIADGPWDDSPSLHKRIGKTYVSPTKFNKRKSGSQ